LVVPLHGSVFYLIAQAVLAQRNASESQSRAERESLLAIALTRPNGD
jgi:hypothetical protein